VHARQALQPHKADSERQREVENLCKMLAMNSNLQKMGSQPKNANKCECVI
jgi:hypothetical protein